MKTQINNNEMIKIISEAEKKARKKQLTHISNKESLSTEDKFKISLCAHFVQYLVENRLKPTELHKKTGIEKTRLSEILHYKINNFTIDKLLVFLNVLAEHSSKIREHVHFLEATMNMPVMTVRESRALTKSLKKVYSPRSGQRSYVVA
jgi:predicted XRE-type DNA-binding protein